jgi:uncharacterized protein
MADSGNILKILQTLQGEIEQRFKATVKGIFGSYARGEERKESDLDLLVDFHEGADLFDYVGLTQFLEEKFHCKVDVVPCDTLREEIKENILKEAVYL